MGANKIRKKFMRDIAPQVLDLYAKQLSGDSTPSKDPHTLNRMWECVQEIILKEGDIRKLEISTTKDILLLLKQGKVSIGDSKELMEMLGRRTEVDVAPELLKQLQKLNKK